MSVHLLRQGARTCRLTAHRVLSSPLSRRPYLAQVAQAAPDSSSHGHRPLETAPEPTVVVDDAPLDSAASSPKKKKGRSRKSAKPTDVSEQPSSEQPSVDPLQPTRVDLYLASLHAAGVEPQLEDLERCRPKGHPSATGPKYAAAYNALVDTLCRSFSKEQLRGFIEAYGLDRSFTRSKKRKIELAETIIEQQWRWPSLKELERAKRDRTEVVIASYPVAPNQLFLILGRDGVDLLQLTMKYNVHISLIRDPLSLRVEGFRGALRALSERLSSLKKGVVEDTIQLPTHAPIEPDLIQRISRLAGAYAENIGSTGLVRLSAKSKRDLNSAKRLATRAISALHSSIRTPLLAYLPVGIPSMTEVSAMLFPHAYSLYPFLSLHTLPWYLSSSGAFRVRRVCEWLASGLEDVSQTKGLAGGKGRILTTNHEAVGLKDVLLGNAASQLDSVGSRTTITASVGHLLYTTPSTEGRSTFIPPVKGTYMFGKILDWIQSHNARATFVPSLPASLMTSRPSQQRLLHRLVYRVLPSPGTQEEQSTDSTTDSPVTLPVTDTINMELLLATPEEKTTDVASESAPPDSAPSESEPSESEPSESVSSESEPSENEPAVNTLSEGAPSGKVPSEVQSVFLSPRCWTSKEAELDLILPDRPIDLRLSVKNMTELQTGEVPPELLRYAADLRTFLTSAERDAERPDPPLMLYRGGQSFILQTSATIRQNIEYAGEDSVEPAVKVVSESILDLESNERATHCEITCFNPESESAWTEFLKQCDTHTASRFQPVGTAAVVDTTSPL